ncbi:MAG: transcriptional repressor [Phycisphaerae bacterium]|nr:transcriptional repressor [Phycisphaerae bacterium]
MKDKALSSSLEDYLEAIYQICRQKRVAHANQISEELQVSKSSVSWALKQLSDKGYIKYAPYEPIVLTRKGETLAKDVAHSHEQLRGFLTGVLGIAPKTAEANACRMEHVVDKEILTRMKKYMDFLDRCPGTQIDWKENQGFVCGHSKTRLRCSECVSDPQVFQGSADPELPDESSDELAIEVLPKLSKERDQDILQRLKEVLHESGLSLSEAGEEIADVFMSCEGHRTLKEIYKAARQKSPDVTMAVVEKTMQMLCEHKIAGAMNFNDQVVYEHLHPESHHDHLFCVKCGAIVEFFDPRIELLQTENARHADFSILMHRLDIKGVCRECLDQESKIRSLDECLQDEAVQVVRFVGDKQMQKRLGDMGLAPGQKIRILNSNCGGGNMIIMAGTGRLMLERSVTSKIKVMRILQDPSAIPGRHRRRHRHKRDRID